MKTLWYRLLLGYGLAFFVVTSLCVVARHQLIEKSASDLRSSTLTDRADLRYYSERDMTKLEALYAGVMLLTFLGTTWWVLPSFLDPLRSLNHQLERLKPKETGRQIEVDEAEGEIKRLQHNINDQLAQANLAAVHLNRYAARVAHELRTPLTIMRLKIEQAADKIDPKLSEEIQLELLRLTIHVEQSLLVARAEQGHLTLNPMRFDVTSIVSEAVDDFRLLAQEQNRTVNFSSVAAYVTADPKYTKQILYNLLNNALRHGSGSVHVRVAAYPANTTIVIGNQIKPPGHDLFNLALGKRIVAALVGLHGNMLLRTRQLHNWYFVRLVIAHL